MVPEPRFELGRPCGLRSLSPLRLPFRHSGRAARVAGAKPRQLRRIPRAAASSERRRARAEGTTYERLNTTFSERIGDLGTLAPDQGSGRVDPRCASIQPFAASQKCSLAGVIPCLAASASQRSHQRAATSGSIPARIRLATTPARLAWRSGVLVLVSNACPRLPSFVDRSLPTMAACPDGCKSRTKVRGASGHRVTGSGSVSIAPTRHEETGPPAGLAFRWWRRRPDSNR